MTDIKRPEDLIPDGVDEMELNGVQVRKGTIGAILANITVIESDHSTDEDKEAALAVIKDLAPAAIATGLSDHVTFNNSQVEAIMQTAKKMFG